MRALFRLSLPTLCLLLTAATAAAQGVTPVNAASYANPLMPNGSIARGSMFVAFGAGLGPASIQYPTPWPFPDSLAGTTIDVTVGSVTKRCFMVYTSAGQIAGILPSDTPIGTGTMTVRYNNAVKGTGPVKVVARSFGIFTINQQGSGPAVATDPLNNSVPYTILNSAAPGDFIDIWGTGLGASLNGNDNGAPQTGNIDAAGIQVYVAGVSQPIVYAGRSGCCTSIDQVRIVAPNITGCSVPIVVVVGGVSSNFATVPIDPSGAACTPDSTFGGPNLSQLQDGGSFTVGTINLMRTRVTYTAALAKEQTINQVADTAQASYSRITIPSVAAFGGINPITEVGACTVYQFSGDNVEFQGGGTSVALDAGNQLTMSGPGGPTTIPKVQGAYFKSFGTPLPFLLPESKAQFGGTYYQPGNTTVTAPGGTGVQAHSASVVVPQEFIWTNKPAFGAAINRATPLTVQYSGGAGYDYVSIYGASPAVIGETVIGAAFHCIANPAAGSFTIPVPVLSALPDSPLINGFPGGSINVGGYISETFNANLDQESMIYADTTTVNVDFN